jgi:hypothetical protein
VIELRNGVRASVTVAEGTTPEQMDTLRGVLSDAYQEIEQAELRALEALDPEEWRPAPAGLPAGFSMRVFLARGHVKANTDTPPGQVEPSPGTLYRLTAAGCMERLRLHEAQGHV